MLLDFIGREIGGFFYNWGLYDAQAVVKNKAEDIVEAIYGLERGESEVSARPLAFPAPQR